MSQTWERKLGLWCGSALCLGFPTCRVGWEYHSCRSPMLEEGLCDDGEAGEGQASAEQGGDPPARSVTGGYSVNVGGGREPLAPTAQ